MKIISSIRLAQISFWLITSSILYQAGTLAASASVFEDFAVYASFLRQLYISPFAPAHPLSDLSPIKVPYWPYLMLSRLIGVWFGLSPERALLLMAIPNTLIFTLGLRAFLRGRFLDPLLTPIALAAILFLWNPWDVWFHNNFFHFQIFSIGLCSPATFAMGVSFFTLEWVRRALLSPTVNFGTLALSAIGLTLALLAHPLTGTFALIGAASVALSAPYSVKQIVLTAALSLFAILVAVWWPLYPLLGELRGAGLLSKGGGAVLYENIVSRLAIPVTVGVILFTQDLKKGSDTFLFYTFLGALSLYVFGAISGSWNLGRFASFAAIAAQLRVAVAIRRWEKATLSSTYPGIVSSTVTVLLVYWFAQPQPIQAAETCNLVRSCSSNFHADDIVLARPSIALCFPPHGPKTVIVDREFYYPGKFEERTRDVSTFFGGSSQQAETAHILRKYNVSLVALHESDIQAERIGNMLLPIVPDRCNGFLFYRIDEIS